MHLLLSFRDKKLFELTNFDELDIYDFLRYKGFGPEFNCCEYLHQDILISHFDDENPFKPDAFGGELFYAVKFVGNKENIFIEGLADDIDIGYEMSQPQADIIDDYMSGSISERVSVKQLEEIDPDKREIEFLYGFAVEPIIKPEQIISWSIYMTLKNGFSQKVFDC